MSAPIGITAHCYPHAGGELEQLRKAMATLARTYGATPRTTIAVWSMAWHVRGVWSIERSDEIVLVMHPDAMREIERAIIPAREADPAAGALITELLGVPVIDIDAGGREALRLRGLIHNTICTALAGVKP